MTAAAVTFHEVSAGYGQRTVLDRVSFAVPEGQVVGVLGPNGAGKSTLLRVLTGLHRPSAGRVELFGHDVVGLAASARAALVGVVPQELEVPMPFTVEEIVMLGRTAALSRWRRPTGDDAERVRQAMAFTDVAGLARRPFPELSGGEKQRVVIAMVLAQAPKIILLDEATSHLDINHRLEILQLMERLNRDQGVTIIMVSHDLVLTAEFAPRLVLLDRGRVRADGDRRDVLTEAHLAEVFHCALRVRQDPETGALSIMPIRGTAPALPARGAP